jgi:hypothetical protein
MAFNEDESNHVCDSCEKEITTEEADTLFESGELVATVLNEDESEVVESEEVVSEEDYEDEEEDEEESVEESEVVAEEDDEDEDEDEEEMEESAEDFFGFSNRDTWAANLIIQNEYKAFRSAVTESAESLQESASEFVSEEVDTDAVNWEEIKTSIEESKEEMQEVMADVVSALSENELPETTQENIKTIFEAGIMMKYNNLKNSLEEQFEVQLAEAKEQQYAELVEKMDEYATEVAEEWLEENKIALEHGIRTEISESFMEGLSNLLKEHYIDVPEDRFDLIEDMADKIEFLELSMAEKELKVDELEKELQEHAKIEIISKVSEGLADTQVEKLVDLSGSIQYESEEQFESKLVALKESFLKVTHKRAEGDQVVIEEETVVNNDKGVDLNDPIQRAAWAMRRKN